jgi:thiamine-phosphate pyrophosphorylase
MPNRTQRASALRVIDANANRAFEGLRTLEEIARFVLDDAAMCGSLKEHRHRLQSALSRLPQSELLQARNTLHDVGTDIKTDSELSRTSFCDIASAAAQRIQQSLRCIEEFSKLVDAGMSREVEAIRYSAYDLLGQMQLRLKSNASFLKVANLYLLIDCQSTLEEFKKQIRDLSDQGVDLIQIRDKSSDARKISSYVLAALDAVSPERTKILVNDRVDIALATGAAGVHLGQQDLECRQVRQHVGDGFIIGVSTHDLQQIDQAIADGADYIGCGPTFPTSTKAFTSFPGLDFLQQAAERSTVPAFAIGGIQLENLASVLKTGITRIAVSSGILVASEPMQVAAAMKSMLNSNSADA